MCNMYLRVLYAYNYECRNRLVSSRCALDATGTILSHLFKELVKLRWIYVIVDIKNIDAVELAENGDDERTEVWPCTSTGS
jgi:hypothetical protein